MRNLGHEVVTAAEIGHHQESDAFLLSLAQQQGRVFVTRDSDFGSLVFVQSLGAGVIYLRMLPINQNEVHAELKRVLELYGDDALKNAFIIIEPNRHRFRQVLKDHE